VIEFLGSLHPAVVHFPIALVVTAAFAEVLHARRRTPPGPSGAALFMLSAAAPFALVSVLFGFAALSGRSFDPGLSAALDLHRVAGVASAAMTALSAGLAASAGRNGERWRLRAYRVILFLTAAAVAVAGHFGAVLTHGPAYPLFR
jgi:uncharacterized membrane protein